MLEFATNTERGSRYGETLVVQNLIDGEFLDAEGDDRFPSTNPAFIRDVVATAPRSSQRDAAAAAEAARHAFSRWRQTPIPNRMAILRETARLLRRHREDLGYLISREVGKVRAGGLGDVDDAIHNLEVFLSEGPADPGIDVASGATGMTCVARRRPLGATAVITPGNYPVAIPVWKIVPALLAGNTIVWKPSEDAPGCAHVLAAAFVAAGLPPGVLNVVHGESQVGDYLMQEIDRGVLRMVSFTGRTGNAMKIAAVCARNLVTPVIQCSAKNPYVVMPTVDVRAAVLRALGAVFANNGQRCTAAANLIIHRDIYVRFRNLFQERVESLRIGDPIQNAQTDLGPMIGERHLKRFVQHYAWGGEDQAKLLYGKGPISQDHQPSGFHGNFALGHYVWPTIWVDVDPRMKIASEEVLGPSVNLIPVDNFEDALRAANASECGLTATLLSDEPLECRKFEEEIEAGVVQINPVGAGGVLPFGGFHRSGNGFRETGRWGFEPFLQWQAVTTGTPGYDPKSSAPRTPAESLGDLSPARSPDKK